MFYARLAQGAGFDSDMSDSPMVQIINVEGPEGPEAFCLMDFALVSKIIEHRLQ